MRLDLCTFTYSSGDCTRRKSVRVCGKEGQEAGDIRNSLHFVREESIHSFPFLLLTALNLILLKLCILKYVTWSSLEEGFERLQFEIVQMSL
jgi:hypothetical protein